MFPIKNGAGNIYSNVSNGTTSAFWNINIANIRAFYIYFTECLKIMTML